MDPRSILSSQKRVQCHVNSCRAISDKTKALNSKILELECAAGVYRGKYTCTKSISDVLAKGHTSLIDSSWFIEAQQREAKFLSRQELERNFPRKTISKLDADDIWSMEMRSFQGCCCVDMRTPSSASTLVVAISHCWLSIDHPDPYGIHLLRLGLF